MANYVEDISGYVEAASYFKKIFHIHKTDTYLMYKIKQKALQGMIESGMAIMENVNHRYGYGEWEITIMGHGVDTMFGVKNKIKNIELSNIGGIDHPDFPMNLYIRFQELIESVDKLHRETEERKKNNV